MSHYNRLADIARSLGLEPISQSDSWQAKTEKLIAILTSHIVNTSVDTERRKPGRPRKE